MEFARKVWKLLVAVKDGLALLLLLVFFGGLYAVLAARPAPGRVQEGALLLDLDGVIVEEPSHVDPIGLLLSARAPTREFRSRDIERALRAAAKDKRIKVVVLDLSRFLGGGYVNLHDIGKALDAVRASGKPILTFANAYADDSVLLAAHASEAWLDPMGGAFVTGPGGNGLYFAKLFEKLKIDAHIYRVGTFKSAVEPYMLEGPSPAAREAYESIYGALFAAWKADVAKARPKANLALVTTDPVSWLKASGGDMAAAAKAAGLVDRIGSKTEFGERVAQLAGDDPLDATRGKFAHTPFDTWIAAHPEQQDGDAIGVVTIAGEIVDGDAGPGSAGGDRIAQVLDAALDQDLKALVVRIDSPGGSTMASERIRRALAEFRERKIPVVVSMGNLAASGGYWVATPGQRIFADPGTITGSIGVFAVLTSFERTLADLGVTGGGVKTTPLSGQPDLFTGLAPEVSGVIQASVENTYGKFLGLVGQARGKTAGQVDAVAQGRPWAGSDARRLGLVDEFGDLDAALAYAARAAKLGNGKWHAAFLGEETDPFSQFLAGLSRREAGGEASAGGGDIAALFARRQQDLLEQAIGQAQALVAVRGVQAYCLECPRIERAATPPPAVPASLLGRLAVLAGVTAR
ncbi:signal peptide peptidase SppA [Novosphingobium album (ex Liu et al. 2023)]|uniref:Signal peptide peptidase SppA n=1 Tax=Novosphingobium album (ex Liu et al. 2023) TaxID=3031130 RepID=A0ABT5WRJ1_9SPHN|nr:signal peptide peptidase SppA [Novosphingobium album (ex Liu et al. 2023)]MDE8652669.1 signal peptide peptidase SppA [Novosphingobium album (ex Liu et al. 2023)]